MLRGIPVHVDWSILLWIILLLMQTPRMIDQPNPVLKSLYVVILSTWLASVLFVSILSHEFGHAYGFRYYKVRSRQITMFLLGGVLQPDQHTFRRWKEEFVVTIAGPLVNLAFAIVLFPIGGLFQLILPGSLIAIMFMSAASLNLFLFGFNMILPVYPADGGRLWHSGFWAIFGKDNYVKAHLWTVSLSVFAGSSIALWALISALTGNYGRIVTILICGFLIYQSLGSLQSVLVFIPNRISQWRLIQPHERLGRIHNAQNLTQREYLRKLWSVRGSLMGKVSSHFLGA